MNKNEYVKALTIAFLVMSVGGIVLVVGNHISNSILSFILTYSSLGMLGVANLDGTPRTKRLERETTIVLIMIIGILWGVDKTGYTGGGEFDFVVNCVAAALLVYSAVPILSPKK